MPGKHALIIGISRYPFLDEGAQLKGSVADARLLARILQKHFDFPQEAIHLLCDEQATRAGIEGAMQELLRRVGTDDSVVIGYSGHGSQVKYGEGDGPDSWDECLVPSDSGRDSLHPVLDMPDDQIHDWLLELSKTTPYICVILDSCFATGTIRDPGFAAPVRRLEPVRLPGRREPKSPRSTLRSAEAQADRWIPPNERCTLIAACRYNEGAHEDQPQPGVFHGALTYNLCRELQAATPGATYLDIFERIEPQITARFPRQHPQLHGARNRELFGVREIRPMRFVPVQKREGRSVVLGGGAAHGLTAGSEWGIYLSGTRNVEDKGRRLGKVRVTEVGSLDAAAEIVDEVEGIDEKKQPLRIEPGARAFEDSAPSARQMAVELASIPHEWGDWLRSWIGRGRKLRLAKPGEQGDVRVYVLAPRETARPEDPVPQLGAVAEPTWAVVARDGGLRMPPVPATSRDSIERLVGNLEVWAHYCHVLEIENRTPDGLREQIDVILQRERPWGGWEPALPDERANAIVFEEGAPVAIEVRNRSTQPVYIYVLDLGLAGRVELLYPVPGADEPLEPGGVLEIGTLKDERMPLTLPKDFPFPGAGNGSHGTVEGMEYLKVFALNEPGDFTPLLQDGFRISKHPWTTETRSFLVRRRSASA